MIVLPPDLVKTKYPGYFWSTTEQRLYSIKVDGILKPLKLRKPFSNFRHINIPEHYQVSVGGVRKILTVEMLKKLTTSPGMETLEIVR